MNTRWTKVAILLCILLLIAGWTIPSVAAESVTIEMEVMPPAIDYTGTFTINGEPAPPGTEVTAHMGDQEFTETVGANGALESPLSVQGTRHDINQEITFSVTELDGTTTTTSVSKTYYPSDDTFLEINIDKETPEVPDEDDIADTAIDTTDDNVPTENVVPDEYAETTEPEEPLPAPGILAPLGTSQVIITDVIQQALSPISQVQEITVPIAMAIERVEAITGLAIFDNFLAFLLIGFVIILFLILMVYRRDRETEEQRRARLRTQSNLLADQNRQKK